MDERILNKKQNSILRIMPQSTLTNLVKIGHEDKISKGTIIYHERDEVNNIYIVLDGHVSLYKNSRYGEIKILFICSQGEILNEDVIEKVKTSVAAKALDEVRLLVIPRNEFQRLLKNDFDLVKIVFYSLSRKTRRLEHQAGNANGTYPLEKHLASKIWKLARDYGEDTEKGKEIRFDVSVTLLANMLGAKRESVSRAVSRLKKDGYIIHENGRLTVTSLENIRTLV